MKISTRITALFILLYFTGAGNLFAQPNCPGPCCCDRGVPDVADSSILSDCCCDDNSNSCNITQDFTDDPPQIVLPDCGTPDRFSKDSLAALPTGYDYPQEFRAIKSTAGKSTSTPQSGPIYLHNLSFLC